MRRILVARVAVAAAVFAMHGAASAVTAVGSLSNFDAVNDTGRETHGFEIELEGLSSADVLYSFGAPYNRYGDPISMDTPTGVIVRWAAQWDPLALLFSTATPVAAPGISPGGHDCYSGGPIGNYLTSGCEHFGVSLSKAQSRTTYRWLTADPDNPGLLAAGGTVAIPAPIFQVVPNPLPAQPPLVQAVIPAPVPESEAGEGRFSDAFWMKRIKTEVQTDEDIQLEQLVNGNDPNLALFNVEIETEYEWFIVQSRGGVPDSGEALQAMNPAAGKRGVATRFEFYGFAGTYDAESNEALCVDALPNCGDLITDGDVEPFRGAYIGAQMAGLNLPAVPEPGTCLLTAAGLALVGISRSRKARAR